MICPKVLGTASGPIPAPGDFAGGIKKGAHVQVEGELRSREYDKDGVKHKLFECRLDSILKLDRAARREESEDGDAPDA